MDRSLPLTSSSSVETRDALNWCNKAVANSGYGLDVRLSVAPSPSALRNIETFLLRLFSSTTASGHTRRKRSSFLSSPTSIFNQYAEGLEGL
jgi:hypothetical protein